MQRGIQLLLRKSTSILYPLTYLAWLVKVSQIPKGISNVKPIFNQMNLPQDVYSRMNPGALQTTFGMMLLLQHLYSVPFQPPYSLPWGLPLLLCKITGLPLVLSHIHQMCTDFLTCLESEMALDACVCGRVWQLCIGQGLDTVVQVVLLVLFCCLDGSGCHVGPVSYMSAVCGILATLEYYRRHHTSMFRQMNWTPCL